MSHVAHLAKRFVSSFSRRDASDAELKMVRSTLSAGECEMWIRFNKQDRRHSVEVANRFVALRPGATRNEIAGVLLHDIGKPATRKLEQGGSVTFHHHDVVGAKLAKKRLTALRFDNDTIKAVCRLIELHLRFFGYSDQQWSDSAVRRYVRDADDQLKRLHILTRADVTTRNQRKADRLAHAYDDLEARIKVLAEQEQLDAMRPDLDGEEIMQLLGIKPGREVGQAYNFLLELRLDEGAVGKDEAKKRLLEWWPNR